MTEEKENLKVLHDALNDLRLAHSSLAVVAKGNTSTIKDIEILVDRAKKKLISVTQIMRNANEEKEKET